jgi:hypothetical protein
MTTHAYAFMETWLAEFPPSHDRKCEHCQSSGADFTFHGHDLCCECMAELCSWLLDGGMAQNPDQFAYLLPAS